MNANARRLIVAAALAAIGPAAAVSAQPVVDGTRDAEYGSALAVQTVNTGFGDNQSELNAAYATVQNGRLYLMLTGNIEANFNKLEIFIDSAAGGENTLTAGGIPDNGVEASANNAAGLTFDAGFAPDYWLFARRGTFEGGKFDLAYVRLGAGGAGSDHLNVFNGAVAGSGTTGTGVNTRPIGVGYDDSNTAGVNGMTGTAADPAAAQAVTTGLELSIALADLGSPANSLRISVLQDNSEHNYLSNQSLGGLPVGTGNLGGDGAGGFTGTLAGVNLNNFAGDQFFTVPLPNYLIADFNSDGRVDVADLGILATNFNENPADPGGRAGADANGDGRVDVADLGILATFFGKPRAGAMSFEQALANYPDLAAAVPEPASLGLLAIGAAGLLARRRTARP